MAKRVAKTVPLLSVKVGMIHTFAGKITSVKWHDEGITLTFDDLKGRWHYPYNGDVQQISVYHSTK